MQDEKPPPVRGYVCGFGQNGDAAEPVSGEVPETLVVVTGNIDDARSLARLAQELLDDVVVLLAPVPGAPYPLDIDDVADEVEIVRFGRAEEIQQESGIASACAEVHVGYPDRAIPVASTQDCIHRRRSAGRLRFRL